MQVDQGRVTRGGGGGVTTATSQEGQGGRNGDCSQSGPARSLPSDLNSSPVPKSVDLKKEIRSGGAVAGLGGVPS